jgi:tetraacyldisaccharide 4'-kinase
MSDRLKQKIETIMNSRKESRFSFIVFLLLIFSYIYGLVLKLRVFFYKNGIFTAKKLPCAVISIGNITVGGTGKTPMTIKTARLAKELGYKVAVISRGYKGSASKKGGIVSDGNKILMGQDQAGDEPFMMAASLKNTPVAVGQNRFRAGMLVIKEFLPDVIILDDAFQHLKLKRDIDIVLLDHRQPLGNNHLLPRGILREPGSALLRSDALVITRSDAGFEPSLPEQNKSLGKKPIFKSVHRPYVHKYVAAKNALDDGKKRLAPPKEVEDLTGRRVFTFSGIAGNSDFRATVKGFGCNIAAFLEFSDHHNYSEVDRLQILRQAELTKVDFIITTEKDYARFAQGFSFPVDLVVIGIEIVFADGGSAFDTFLSNRLAQLIKDQGFS